MWEGWEERWGGRAAGALQPPSCPEVWPRALDPRSWIPWSLSWPWVLTPARERAVEAREALSS